MAFHMLFLYCYYLICLFAEFEQGVCWAKVETSYAGKGEQGESGKLHFSPRVTW